VADLFVSYKSEDRGRVAPLVAALEADGVTLWWDAHIGGGSAWRDAIEGELNAARCVLVVWSKRSTGPEGSFVRDEATRALRRGVYLPIRIDPIEPPLGFGETQALPLIGWKGDRADPRYVALLAAVRATMAGEPRPVPPAAYRATRRLNRRLLLGGGVAAVAASGGGLWWAIHRREGTASDSVAVLPFANLSGDPAQAYFSDGLAEELRSALTRIVQLKVAARTSSELVRDADVATAARSLRVANIITGSVRRGASSVRVSAQLIDGSSGLTKWSDSYDRADGDVLRIESDIAERVAQALKIVLGRATRALLTLGGTNNPAALDAYLRGKAFAGKQQDEASINAFEAAIAADPDYASARAARARAIATFAAGSLGGAALRARLADAEREAKRAVALAPGLGSPLAALATVLDFKLDFARAAAAYDGAIQAAPGDAVVLRVYAHHLASLGRGNEAVAQIRKANELDPLRPSNPIGESEALLSAGLFDEALAAARLAYARLPGSPAALRMLAFALFGKKGWAEAMQMAALLPAGDPFSSLIVAIAAWNLGDRPASDRALAKLIAEHSDDGRYQIAEGYAQRGEIDAAFSALDQAYAMLDPGVADTKGDPSLAPLHGDPRFAAFLRKVGLF
jgi:TolB-like protein